MELKDLFITPIWLLIIYAIAYGIKSRVTDARTARYFIPALSIKIAGAILLGMIFQFYYGYGGDTFAYFNYGSKYIYNAFQESPTAAFDLIFTPRDYPNYPSSWASRIYAYRSETEFFIIRIAGFFDLFTFHTYSATSSLFAFFSFSGVWAFYTAVVRIYPILAKKLAWAILFIPSVVFWGSGLLKDPITLMGVGWIMYGVINIFQFGRALISSSILIFTGAFVVYSVKIYILLCLLPCIVFWIFLKNLSKIKNRLIRTVLGPIFITAGLLLGVISTVQLSASSSRYSLENIQQTAEETAWWISYSGDQQGGSTYTLGDLDYSTTGIIRKALPAIWVALYRPHPWEVGSPIMAISALENLFFLWLSFTIFRRFGFKAVVQKASQSHMILFFLLFSILFAFSVGLTTYNFGSLARYKIPLIPFYVSAIYMLEFEIKKDKMVNHLKKSKIAAQMRT